MRKAYLGALLSVAAMGGGELMKFSLERPYGGKSRRRRGSPQNKHVEYYIDEKGNIRRNRK